MNGPESATPPTDLPPQIRHAPGLTVSAAEAALLARAFAGQPEIFVEREFRSGYSGAEVLLVSPGAGQAQVVVKLGPPGDLRREYAAYRQFVEKSAPQNTARLQSAPIFAPDGQLALLSYTFAGGDPRLPTRSLHAYYDSRGAQATATVLDRVFRIYGRQWWANNRPRKFVLAEQYDRLLPVHLKLKPVSPAAEVWLTLTAGQTSAAALRDLQPGQIIRLCDFEVSEVRPDRAEVTLTAEPPPGEASAPARLRLETTETASYLVGARLPQLEGVITATRQALLAEAATAILSGFEPNAPHFTLAGRTYQNPLFDLSGVLDRVIEARESIIHGDLNLQNILVDGDTGFAWLIDFAETRSGPTLFDVQRLEAQVITKLLPPAITQASLEPVVVADLLQALHADPPSPLAPQPALQEPYTLLVALRRLARQYLMDDRDWEEYYLGLRLVLVGTLKYTDLLPIGHRSALVGAAVAKELMAQPLSTSVPVGAGSRAVPSPKPQPISGAPTLNPAAWSSPKRSSWPRWLALLKISDWFKPQPQSPLALVVNVQGQVEVRRKAGERLLPAAFGMPLFYEDAIITYEASSTDVICDNGYLFHLDWQSTLVVRCGDSGDQPPLDRMPPDLARRLTQPSRPAALMTQADLAAAAQLIRALPISRRAHHFLLARLYHHSSSPEEAIAELERLSTDPADTPGLAQALGTAYLQAGKVARAESKFLTALNSASLKDDLLAQAEAQTGLGHIAKIRQDPETANTNWQTALTLYRQAGDDLAADRVAQMVQANTQASDEIGQPHPVQKIVKWLKQLWIAESASSTVIEPEPNETPTSWLSRLGSALNMASSAVALLLLIIIPLIILAATLAGRDFIWQASDPTSTPSPITVAELTPSATMTHTPFPTSTPVPGTIFDEIVGDLNVFSGPGTNYAFVASISKGLVVEVIGRDVTGNWWNISWADGEGWVEAPFVNIEVPSNLPLIGTLPPVTFTLTPIPKLLNLLPLEHANIARIEPVANFDAHEGPVLQVAFSSDGKLLASSGGDGKIKIWSATNAQLIATLDDHPGWIQTGVFSPDNLWLASGGSDRIVRLWDRNRRQIFAEFYGHNGFVFSNAFHPDSNLLASSSLDGTVRLWDIESETQVAILEGGANAVYEIAFNPTGTELVSGSIDGFVRVWDIATFEKVCEFSTASVLSVAYNPDGNSLASGNTRGEVITLSARCQPQRILEGHTDNVNSVAYSPDGQLLASGSRDTLVKLWSLPPTAEPVTLSEHLASVETVTFSPDGLRFVSGSAEGKIILWGVIGN